MYTQFFNYYVCVILIDNNLKILIAIFCNIFACPPFFEYIPQRALDWIKFSEEFVIG